MRAALAEAVESALRHWPKIDHDRDAFLEELGARVQGEPDAEAALRALHVEDLYVASACVAGRAEAIAVLEREYLAPVDRVIGALRAPQATLDDVKAMLRASLLVAGPNQRPLITSYSGKGRLVAWLQVVATRMALRELRRAGRLVPTDLEGLMAIPDAGDDPEVLYAKSAHREEFEEAFREALGELSPRHRNVLRYRYLDGLSLERLAAMYRVDRATAVRWLAKARGAVLSGTRRLLMKRLGVRRDQVSSLMRGMLSQLDVSLQHLLQTATR
jgi:RNA polymerase sigma-70 factor (ECF subfamily)